MDGEEEGEEEEGEGQTKAANELFQLSGTLLNPEAVPSFAATIVENDELR